MVNHVIRFLAPRILAAILTTFWAAGTMTAAVPQLNKISNTQVEITGGSGKEAWRLRYGLYPQAPCKLQFVATSGNRAWYGYCGWLRLIDTEKGVVIGRWHFPGEIVNLTPEGTKIQVEDESANGPNERFVRKLELDPSAPHVPYWPTSRLVFYRVPVYEGQMVWPSVFPPGAPGQHKISAEEAKKILPDLEDAVRRDPLTPWFRVGLGRVLRALGDPRATEVFQEAIKTPATDFIELFQVSIYFDVNGENDLGQAAFERSYQDFWQKGNDPRMLTALIDYLILCGRPHGGDWGNPATPHGRELIERVYKMMPYGEGTPFAWQLYADYLAAHGSADDARLWRSRAEDSSRNAAFTFSGSGNIDKRTEVFILVALVSALAAVFYMVVLCARYRPQSRLDLAARKQASGLSRVAAFMNAHYWSRQERFALFTIVLVAWVSMGLVGEYVSAILRTANMPVSALAGSYGGPGTIAKFENDLLATPQRDLMLAIAYQQDGQLDKAEGLYRSLPQFAESWNNLGVILREAGKDQEAKATFEKALELDPKMAEAALNLGRPPSDFWTEQHYKYLPGQPMLSPPSAPHITTALMGGSTARIFLRALAGPFSEGSIPIGFKLLRNLYD